MNARAASLCELIVRLSFGDCWAPVSAPCRGGRPKRDGVREEKASKTRKGKNSFVVSCGACGCYSLSSEVPQNPKKSPAVTCIMSCVFQSPPAFRLEPQDVVSGSCALHGVSPRESGPRDRWLCVLPRGQINVQVLFTGKVFTHIARVSFATSLRSRLLLRAAARKTLLAPLCGI